MHKKRVPLRKCLGCLEMKPKSELVRVVKSPKASQYESIELDLVGKNPGRGAYICKDSNCLNSAIKAKRFQRSLSCKIPDEVFEKLKEELISDEP